MICTASYSRAWPENIALKYVNARSFVLKIAPSVPRLTLREYRGICSKQQHSMDPRAAKMIQLGRNALAQNKVDTAIQLLHAASRSIPDSPEIWYYLGTAPAKQSGTSSNACICFLRALQLFDIQESLNDQAQQLAAAAADNVWLMANSLLPVAWAAAAADAALQGNLSAAADYVIRQAVAAAAASSSNGERQQQQVVQLVCVGGLGIQAMQLAAAAAAAIQASYMAEPQQQQQQQQEEEEEEEGQEPDIPLFGMSFVPSDALTSHIAAQIFSDNDLDDVIEISTWQEWQQQQQHVEQQQQQVTAALLAGCIQPNWAAAAAACLNACKRLAAASSSSSSNSSGSSGSSSVNVLSPSKVRVWAAPVSCKDLLNLNEVDLTEIQKVTSGRFDYSHVNTENSNLRRNDRPCQVSRFKPVLLVKPQVVMELDLQQLLLCCQQQQQQQQPGTVQGNSTNRPAAAAAAAAAAVELALSKGQAAVVSSNIVTTESGRLDCVVWWLEFCLTPECSVNFQPAAAAAAKAPGEGVHSVGSSSSSLPDVLKPHIWQHVQYLPQQQQQQEQQVSSSAKISAAAAAATGDQALLPVYQGQQVTSGQQLLLQVTATADRLNLALFHAAAASSSSNSAPLLDLSGLSLHHHQQQQQQGRDILPYHMSMLNDHDRTRSYDLGITAAVQCLIAQQQQQQQQQGVSRPQIVLDVGCGTGLLSMMAAAAAASSSSSSSTHDAAIKVIGCERNPVLAAAAQQLVKDNNLQDHVTVIQKLSSQLTVRSDSAVTKNTRGKINRSNDKSNSKSNNKNNSYDMDQKAALVVHEIFGTDPLSEQVLPALRQVQLELAAAAAGDVQGNSPAAAAVGRAKFVPRALRIVAAVAQCSKLYQYLRLPAHPTAAAAAAGSIDQQQQWDMSSLLLLLPRKCEMQCDEVAADLLLLTQPAAVLEFDFEQQWPLPLNGQVAVQLPILQQPLLLADWMQQQQQQQDATGVRITPTLMAPAAAAAGGALQGNSPAAAAASAEDKLCVISWFEADCGAGGWYTTAPGFTKYGHWQQSVEFVQAPARSAAAAAAGGGSSSSDGFTLRISWAVDRIKFALV